MTISMINKQLKNSTKSFFTLFSIAFLFLFFLPVENTYGQKRKKIKKEDVQNICQNIPLAERPRLTVSNFKIQARKASGRFGGELGAMLTNSIRGTGCFDVLETVKELADEFEEISFGQSGGTDGSGASGGNMLGSQLVLTGTITEFDSRQIHILGIGNDKAHIGFILKMVDIETRQIIWSESFNTKVTRPQLKVLGTDIMQFGSQAMEDAAEKAIIKATMELSNQKELFAKYKDKKGNSGSQYSRGNCPTIQNTNPSVMVIIPEIHISRKVPDPAGETEIIKKLIATGFRVLDPSVYQNIRNTEKLNTALRDPSAAADIGAEYGADIVIVGEAFSEADGRKNGMFSCRARLEARAVSTQNAQILGADGKHAGGMDNTELVAGKTALRNAGSQMADYFIDAICSASVTSNGNSSGGSGASSGSSSEIVINNVNFSDLMKIEKFLKSYPGINNVTKKMSGKNARLKVSHTVSLDEIAGSLSEGKSGVSLEITGFETNKFEAVLN